MIAGASTFAADVDARSSVDFESAVTAASFGVCRLATLTSGRRERRDERVGRPSNAVRRRTGTRASMCGRQTLFILMLFGNPDLRNRSVRPLLVVVPSDVKNDEQIARRTGTNDGRFVGFE